MLDLRNVTVRELLKREAAFICLRRITMLETNEYQKPLDIREIILVDSDEIIPDNKHSYIIKIKD